MDVMSITETEKRQPGKKRILSDGEEEALRQEYKALPRKARVLDLAIKYGVARSTLYTILDRGGDGAA